MLFFGCPEESSPTSQAILNPVKLTSKIKYDGDVLPGWGPEGEGWRMHWSLGEIGNVIHSAEKWGEVRWEGGEGREEERAGGVRDDPTYLILLKDSSPIKFRVLGVLPWKCPI